MVWGHEGRKWVARVEFRGLQIEEDGAGVVWFSWRTEGRQRGKWYNWRDEWPGSGGRC